MTPAQKLRLIGFNASLTQRGVSLALTGSESPVTALVDEIPLEGGGDHGISDETRDMVAVALLRTAAAGLTISPGFVFSDEESGASYRVVRKMSKPQDFVLRFKCEASFPDEA